MNEFSDLANKAQEKGLKAWVDRIREKTASRIIYDPEPINMEDFKVKTTCESCKVEAKVTYDLMWGYICKKCYNEKVIAMLNSDAVNSQVERTTQGIIPFIRENQSSCLLCLSPEKSGSVFSIPGSLCPMHLALFTHKKEIEKKPLSPLLDTIYYYTEVTLVGILCLLIGFVVARLLPPNWEIETFLPFLPDFLQPPEPTQIYLSSPVGPIESYYQSLPLIH